MALNSTVSKIIKKTFDLYDCDNSGCLDPYELQSFLNDIARAFRLPKLNSRQMNWALNYIDDDKSGTIEFEELTATIGTVIDKLSNKYLANNYDDASSSDLHKDQYSDESNEQLKGKNWVKSLGAQLKLLKKINIKKESKNERQQRRIQGKKEMDSVVELNSNMNSGEVSLRQSTNKVDYINPGSNENSVVNSSNKAISRQDIAVSPHKPTGTN